MISELIDKQDSFELVRDQIAAILLAETTSQQALATAATKDARLWAIRLFVERTNPWSEYTDAPAQLDATPIVNVAFDSSSFDGSKGSVVDQQRASATFNIDCYGYGTSEDDGAGGHIAGDQRAALEAQRVARLVRNFLMAGEYAYLGMRGNVGRRWVQSITMFQPQMDGQTVQHVVGARIAVQVDFNEYAPQVQGPALELVSAGVKRRETGEIYFTAGYGA